MDVAYWLYKIGLPQLTEAFAREGIDADVLPDLTNEDLKELGVTRLGDRKKLLRAIEALDTDAQTSETAPSHAGMSASAQSQTTDVVSGGTPVVGRPSPAAPDATVHEAQRRQLTVMFCDLVGSTSLSTALDPEDLRDLIRSYQSVCRKVIVAHNGFISRYMGDGIMVYFGYPQANEHSAESAVRAAMQIIEQMQQLNQTGRQHAVDLSVRLGIATGPVVVGDLIGDGASEEAAVVGETPNLAARLQGLAEPDNVVISNATMKLAGPLFEYEDLGEHSLKGIAQPVPCWRVVQEVTDTWRYTAKLTGDGMPLVDRRDELTTLMRCWNQSKAGQGQAVVITAEAGMGKSRLAYAVEEQLADEEHHLLRLQGVSFRKDTALFPAVEYIRSAAAISHKDAADERYRKLRALTQDDTIDDVETFQLLAPLFSLDISNEFDALELGPNHLKLLTLRSIWHTVEKLAEEKPVLVLVEDYHWIDPTSRELLDLAINEVANSRTLLIITQRTEDAIDVDWSRHPQATLMTLGKLGAEDVHQLVSNTVAASTLPNHMQQQIYRKTDGNPLFVEELTHMLLEQMRTANADNKSDLRTSAKTDTGIPSTLQDLLLARLDQLGTARSLAQHASCYGRTFGRRGLEIISPLSNDELSDQLEHLLQSGLVHKVADRDDCYEFKHALVQDAAYESLLKSTRIRIHSIIADHFEPELCDNEPEVLAHHFGRAGNALQERNYWHKAARRSMASGAFVEAISYFKQALQALKKEAASARENSAQETDFNAVELELLVESAVPSTLTRGWAAEDVGQAYERAHELSQQQGSSPLLFAALSGIFRYYLVTGNYELAEQVALIDLARAEQSGDDSVVMEFALHPGVVYYYTGRSAEALPYLLRSADMYDLDKHREHISIYGQCTATVALSHQGKALTILGRTGEAFDCSRKAVEIAEQSGHVFSVAWGMSNYAANHILLENPSACNELATSMIEISAKADFINWVAQGLVWQGWSIAHDTEAGSHDEKQQADTRIQDGLGKIQEGIGIWQMTGASLMQPFYFVLLAQCHLLAGETDSAQEALTTAREIIDRTGERWPQPLWQLTAIKLAVATKSKTAQQACDELRQFIHTHSLGAEWLWVVKAQRFLAQLEGADSGQAPLYQTAEQYKNFAEYPPVKALTEEMKGTT